MRKTLLTGGTGLLGRHLIKEMSDIYAPPRAALDIAFHVKREGDIKAVIHAAAYTDVAGAETTEQMQAFQTNVMGTYKLLQVYGDLPFIYISSEYANNPQNLYSNTKYVGELFVSLMAKKYLIIRTLFKPSPWPFDTAFQDQFTQGDYVDVIARLIAREIKTWDDTSKIVYVGTGRKTMYDLARRTKPDVIPNSVDDIKGVKIPKDYK